MHQSQLTYTSVVIKDDLVIQTLKINDKIDDEVLILTVYRMDQRDVETMMIHMMMDHTIQEIKMVVMVMIKVIMMVVMIIHKTYI